MIDGNYTDDFFSDQVPGKKNGKPARFKKYSGQRFLPYVRIPVEYAVIIAIMVLVLMIISYAIGVERGKRLSLVSLEQGKIRAEDVIVESEEAVSEEAEKTSEVKKPSEKSSTDEDADVDILTTEDITVLDEKAFQQQELPQEPVRSAYIIQLASFKDRDSAEEEVDKLKEDGIKANISESGDWYQVFAEGYQTIDEAKTAHSELLGTYADCYIRKVR